MAIHYVAQEDKHGCGIACLAMVTGKTYKQVETEITHREHGITDMAIQAYLADKGYVSAWKHRYVIYTNQPREEWPPKPWANIHVALVYSSAGGHLIVVFRDGSVWDPAKPGLHRFEDYPVVSSVGAIYKWAHEIDCRITDTLQEDIDLFEVYKDSPEIYDEGDGSIFRD